LNHLRNRTRRASTFALLAAAFAATALAAAPEDAQRIDYPEAFNLEVGISPYFVIAEDLNGDGHLDLASSNTVSHSVTVLLNRGNGTFEKGVSYPTKGYTPYALAAGDLDGDGYLDLVCGNMFSVDISIFFNKGDGTFEDSFNLTGEPGAMFTVITDLDGDGRKDIATSNIGHDDVAIFLNRGGRKFEHTGTFKCRGVVPYSVIAADFDRDGDQDLATGNIYSSNVSILMNDGHASFAEAITYATDSLTQILYPADFNGDGAADIVSGNGGSDNVSVLINRGDGTFAPAVNYPVKLPQGVTAADIDGDGDLDIATANQSAHTSSILLNQGDGTFGPAIDVRIDGLYPTSVLLADLNHDHRLDLVTANSGSNNLSVLLRGLPVPMVERVVPSPTTRAALVDGQLQVPVRATFNTDLDPASLDAGTIRLIGSVSGFHPSSIRYEPDSRTVEVVPADGRHFVSGEQVALQISTGVTSAAGLAMKTGFLDTFELEPENGFGSLERSAQAATLGARSVLEASDLDRDGRVDLLVLEEGSASVSVFWNAADGLFGERTELPTGGLDPRAAAVADFDSDGEMDIALLNELSMDLALLYNEGGRRFGAPRTVPLDFKVSGLTASDFDGNGFVDLALGNELEAKLFLLFNRGERRFDDPKKMETVHLPMMLRSKDVDGDGLEDLITVDRDADVISIYRSQGNGKFLSAAELKLLPSAVSELLIWDLTFDGAPEILTANLASGDVAVFVNQGDGNFERPYYVTLDGKPTGIALADLDADGEVELIASHDTGLSVLTNPGNGRFGEATFIPFTSPVPPVMADFDGDGAVDLVVASSHTHELAFFVNQTVRKPSEVHPTSR
jgi:FG-GAP-like repeat